GVNHTVPYIARCTANVKDGSYIILTASQLVPSPTWTPQRNTAQSPTQHLASKSSTEQSAPAHCGSVLSRRKNCISDSPIGLSSGASSCTWIIALSIRVSPSAPISLAVC